MTRSALVWHPMPFSRYRDILLLAILVLLPWQARFIKEIGLLGGIEWEPATASFHALELLILAALVAHVLAKDRAERKPPAFLGLWALLVLYALFSLLWARRPEAAFWGWVHLFEGFALAYLLWNSGLRLRHALWAFVAGGALDAGFGLWQFLTQSSFSSTLLGVAAHAPEAAGTAVVETAAGRFVRAYGLLPHPNVLGGHMALALLSAVALYARPPGRAGSSLALGAAVILFSALVASFSRSAWLGYATAMLAATAVRSDVFGRVEKTRFWKALAAQATTGLLALAFLGPLVLVRAGAEGRLEARSLSERMLSVYQGSELFRDHYALGVGLNNMPDAAFRELRPQQEPHSYQPAHLVPLLVLVELGFFGFAILLGAVWFWLSSARSVLKTASDVMVRFAAVMPVVLLAIGLFDHYPVSQFSGALLAGAAFGFHLLSSREPPLSSRA